MAAAVTTRLKVGSGICLVIERDPITLAKEVATLDYLSGGRFLFGIGGGWNAEEMANHGTEFAGRWKVLRERIEAMKAIWRDDDAAYHGDTVNFDPIWSWPKPAQKPHPPIYLGGHGPKALDRVVRYCDGWMPIPMRGAEPARRHRRPAGARHGGRARPVLADDHAYGVPADADARAIVRGRRQRARRLLAAVRRSRQRSCRCSDRFAALCGRLPSGDSRRLNARPAPR